MPAVPEPGHGSYFLSNAVHSARRSPDVHLHANAADGEGGEADRGGAPLGNRGQPGEPRNCLARSSAFSFARRRSEEHTSELQSLMRISYAVFCLKKKNQKEYKTTYRQHISSTPIEKSTT